MSAEERAAALHRAGESAPNPGSHLSEAAKEIWRRIAEDRPLDWFRWSSVDLLDDYAETVAMNRDTIAQIWKLDVLSDERDRLIKQKALLSARMAATAAKLRITVQSDVRHDSGKITEKGEGGTRDPLLGLSVLRGGKR